LPDSSTEDLAMLRLRDVCKTFVEPGGEELKILDIERFDLAEGEQCAVVGRSGCGKSTLLHVIAGISRPDSGMVEIDGQDITTLPEAAVDRFRATHVGYVFQTFNLLPAFTALENVLLGMAFVSSSHDRSRAEELLERVGLSHRLDHRPGKLSVGEQQRVAVARALANQPRLMLADEPTASVDSRHQQKIIDLLQSTCREENVALLVVTHNEQVAAALDRVESLEQLNRITVAG
jgi:ABC-type lipoprotein export system ATPase subunit